MQGLNEIQLDFYCLKELVSKDFMKGKNLENMLNFCTVDLNRLTYNN